MWEDTEEQLKRKSTTGARRMTKLRVAKGREKVIKWMGIQQEEKGGTRVGLHGGRERNRKCG